MAEIDEDFIESLSADPDVAMKLHRQNAAQLLSISIEYCQEFVPAQLKQLEEHIAKVNKQIERCGNGKDMQSLTAALLSLIKGHGAMQEQSTIVYMANTRPLMSLLASADFASAAKAMSDADSDEDDGTVDTVSSADAQAADAGSTSDDVGEDGESVDGVEGTEDDDDGEEPFDPSKYHKPYVDDE